MKQTNRGEAVKGYGKHGLAGAASWAESPGSRDGQQHLVMHQQEHDEKAGSPLASVVRLQLDDMASLCPPIQGRHW